MSRRQRPNKVKKIIKNLKRTFNDGQYYEGEQMLKTIHARLMNQDDFEQAGQLLSAGAMTLFEHKQITAGIAILDDLIETWSKADNQNIDALKVDLLTKMYNLIDNNEIQYKVDFIKSINKWVKQVKKENQSKYNDSQSQTNENESKQEKEKVVINYYKYSEENIDIDNVLTKLYKSHAIALWNVKLYNLASIAFTKAKNVEMQIELCQEWSNVSTMNKFDKEKEYNFLLTRMVIQFLVFGAVCEARQFANETIHKNTSQRHPLENFMDLLVESVEKKSVQLYQIVCRTYFPLLKNDEQLMAYMQKVGDVCLGIPPPRQSGGLLGNIMSLFS